MAGVLGAGGVVGRWAGDGWDVCHCMGWAVIVDCMGQGGRGIGIYGRRVGWVRGASGKIVTSNTCAPFPLG